MQLNGGSALFYTSLGPYTLAGRTVRATKTIHCPMLLFYHKHTRKTGKTHDFFPKNKKTKRGFHEFFENQSNTHNS